MSKYFQSPCRIKLATAQRDLGASDFKVSASAEPDGDGEFNVTVTIEPATLFGDVKTVKGVDGSANLYDDVAAESSIENDSATYDVTPATVTFIHVAQTEENVGNTWKIQVINLDVTTKGGQNLSIPDNSFTFPSPL